jgi:AcrR family transcriptional regulator
MPPRVKITKDDIIKKSIELIRNGGEEAMNARAIAASLNCSTQPIFSNFSSMDDLHSCVCTAVYEMYLHFIKKEVESEKYPKYKAFGMAYLRFAKDQKELFKFLFMRDRSNEDTSPSQDFKESVRIIMEANGFSEEKAMLLHMEMWAFVHGIATMLATSFLSLDFETISSMMTDVYQGILARHKSEEKQCMQ